MAREIDTFNETLVKFVDELKICFPQNRTIKTYASTIGLLNAASKYTCCNSFMESVSSHKEKIRTEDETLWKDLCKQGGIFKTLQLDILWKDLPAGKEPLIWKYVQTLFVLGQEVVSSPQEEDEATQEDDEDDDPLSFISRIFPPGVMEQMIENTQRELGDGRGGIDESKLQRMISKMSSSLVPPAAGATAPRRIKPSKKK